MAPDAPGLHTLGVGRPATSEGCVPVEYVNNNTHHQFYIHTDAVNSKCYCKSRYTVLHTLDADCVLHSRQ